VGNGYNIDNLKWGHVLEWIYFARNLNVLPNVLSYTILLWALVLRFLYNKYGDVLSISGGFKHKLFIKCMFSFVCEAIWNLFKILIKWT